MANIANTKEHSESNDPAISHSPSCVSGRVLHLTLKKKWFDMIASGEKTEEYREIKPYWFQRLVFDYKKPFEYCTGYKWDDDLYRIDGVKHVCFNKKTMVGFVPYTHIKFKNGYSKNAPMITVECKGIDLDYSKAEWCDGIKDYFFVIKLGNVLYKRD